MWQEFHSLSAEAQAQHRAKWGGYNDFPPLWRRISRTAFAENSLFFIFSPTLVEYRQMLTPERDKPAVGVHLFFYHENVGYAIDRDQRKGTLQFYAFGCDQPHPNRTTCDACGFRADYDTSD